MGDRAGEWGMECGWGGHSKWVACRTVGPFNESRAVLTALSHVRRIPRPVPAGLSTDDELALPAERIAPPV